MSEPGPEHTVASMLNALDGLRDVQEKALATVTNIPAAREVMAGVASHGAVTFLTSAMLSIDVGSYLNQNIEVARAVTCGIDLVLGLEEVLRTANGGAGDLRGLNKAWAQRRTEAEGLLVSAADALELEYPTEDDPLATTSELQASTPGLSQHGVVDRVSRIATAMAFLQQDPMASAFTLRQGFEDGIEVRDTLRRAFGDLTFLYHCAGDTAMAQLLFATGLRRDDLGAIKYSDAVDVTSGALLALEGLSTERGGERPPPGH